MGFRDHGYYGYAFVGVRPLQIVSLITVVGLAGNFVSEDSHAHLSAPSQLIGTLVISCLALLWTLLSFTAYDDTHFPYVATCALDTLFMVPFIVVAAVFGAPLSAMTCSSLPARSADASFLALAVHGNTASNNAEDYIFFVGNNQGTCNEVMAMWGFTVALCVLFALSGCAAGLLFLGNRRAAALCASDSQIELAPPAGYSKDGMTSSQSDAGSFYGAYPSPPVQAHVDGGRAVAVASA